MTSSASPQYLVSYGVNGSLGCFVPADVTCQYERGTQVWVQSERGQEAGIVLCPHGSLQLPGGVAHTPGTILGLLPRDERMKQEACHADERYADAVRFIQSLFLPVQVIDVEELHQPDSIVLHVLLLSPLDVFSLQQQFSERWQIPVVIQNHADPEALEEAAESGCGSCSSGGGCGSGDCGSGCSTGGCHSDTSPATFEKDWRAYFAELRAAREQKYPLTPDSSPLGGEGRNAVIG